MCHVTRRTHTCIPLYPFRASQGTWGGCVYSPLPSVTVTLRKKTDVSTAPAATYAYCKLSFYCDSFP